MGPQNAKSNTHHLSQGHAMSLQSISPAELLRIVGINQGSKGSNSFIEWWKRRIADPATFMEVFASATAEALTI